MYPSCQIVLLLLSFIFIMIVLCDSCYADIESHICWFMRRGNIVTAPNAVVLLSISNARHPITVVSMSSSSSI